MDLIKTITGRRSIRAFKPDPVPREKVEEILNIAIQAPSAINLQPWEFTIVMGEEKERLSRKLVKLYREKQISCSPGNVKPLADSFTRRGVASFELMNPILEQIGTDFNRFVNEGSCNFYGAPHCNHHLSRQCLFQCPARGYRDCAWLYYSYST